MWWKRAGGSGRRRHEKVNDETELVKEEKGEEDKDKEEEDEEKEAEEYKEEWKRKL